MTKADMQKLIDSLYERIEELETEVLLLNAAKAITKNANK